jgi:hypothetical protein
LILKISCLVPPVVFFVFRSKAKFEKSLIAVVAYLACLFILLHIFKYIPPYTVYEKIYYLIYTFSEYSFFTYIFLQIIIRRNFRIFILSVSLCYIIFLIFYFFTSRYRTIDSIPIGIETILIFLYTIYYLYEQFKNPEVQFLNRTFSFWLVIGIVIYLSGSFFIYILANHIPYKELIKYWFLTYVFDIIKNIFFAISIYIYANHSTKKANYNKSIPFLDLEHPPSHN